MRSLLRDIEIDLQDHHYMVKREHQLKAFITVGCCVSAVVATIYPHLNVHAMVLTVATNVVWVWS